MSIKNKLVTAVTTAGLLAGLFGSAFMPAARAAADNAASITCAADGDVEYQTAASGIVYAPAGATVSCVVTLDRTTDGLATLTATGGHTIVSVPSVDASAGAAGAHASSSAVIWTINAAGTSASANLDQIADNDDDETADDVIFTVNVKVGSAEGFLNVFKGTAAGTELADIQFTPSSDAAAVPSGNYSQVSAPCAPITMEVDGDIEVSATNKVVADEEVTDINTANTANLPLNTLKAAGGTYCTSSTGIPAVAAGGVYFMQVKAYDAYGVAVPTTANVAISATLSAGSPAGVEVLDVPTSLTGSVDDDLSDSLAETDGLDYVVITGDGDAGTTTVTVTVGSLTYTRTVIFLGGVDTITLSGPTHMATVGAEQAGFFDALSVVCKDEAGTVIGDGGGLATSYTDGDLGACIDTNVSFEVFDGDANVTSTYSDDSSNGAATTTTEAYEFNDEHIYIDVNADAAFDDDDDDFSVAQDGNWSIPWELCQDGDEGETRKIKVKNGIISSNQITLTCVENKVKITSLTALATGTSGSATSGANGQTIKVSVAATDGYGRPAGTGAKFTFTTAATGGSSSGATAYFGGGSATLTITLGATSGAQYVIYSAADGDQVTTGSQAFAQKISFTVSNAADALTARTISVGPKGIVVTASGFAAGSVVKFEVENAATGVVRTYSRKANASGVATWKNATSALKYVTAYPAADTSAITETIEVKR